MQEIDERILTRGISASRELRVIVVPVGKISERKFSEFFSAIKTFSAIELRQVTPIARVDKRTPFTQLSWQDGRLYCDFIDARTAHRSDWENFQAHKRIMGLLGIIHCPTYSDLEEAHKEFEQMREQHPTAKGVKCFRCFAFEPLDHQPDWDSSSKSNFIMIPNTAGNEKHLLFYLNTLLNDFAASLIFELENMFASEQWLQSAYIATPFDPPPSSDEVIRLKKRKEARVAKLKGDYCVLAGDPKDALQLYQEAVLQCRANSDLVWLAGAIEGEAAALIICNGDEITTELRGIIKSKYEECLLLYSRSGAVMLELEASLKLARFYADACRKCEASEYLSRAYSLSQQNCSIQETIMVCTAIAWLYSSMNMQRKFAHFIREAANLQHKLYRASTAHRLFLLIAPHYQLPCLTPSYAPPSSGPFDMGHPREGWLSLQVSILKSLIDTSCSLHDPATTASYTVHLLRRSQQQTEGAMAKSLSRTEECGLGDSLSNLSEYLAGSSCIDMHGIPQFLSLRLIRLDRSLYPEMTAIPIEEKEEPVDKDNPFIYTPLKFQHKKGKVKAAEETLWVADTVSQAVVHLANPFPFEIYIESIMLSCTGVAYQGYPVSVRLPPHTSSQAVILSGKPLEEGTLTIRGCLMRVFNLLWEYPIDEAGFPSRYDRSVPTKGEPGVHNRATVVPALPLLKASLATHNVTQHVLQGERATLPIAISNIGSLPVENLELWCEWVSDNESAPLVHDQTDSSFEWDSAFLLKQLPILPGIFFTLPVYFWAQPKVEKGKVIIRYGCGRYRRTIELDVNFHCEEALRLVGFNVQAYAYDIQSSRSDIDGVDLCLLTCEIENRASYAFTLSPSSDCLPTESKGTPSEHHNDKILFLSEATAMTLEPKCVTTMSLPMKRLILEQTTPETAKIPLCLAHIRNNLCLEWKAVGRQSQGKFQLNEITLTSSMCRHLITPAVRISAFWKEDGQSFEIGRFFDLMVQIQNHTSTPLRLNLQIQPYQDMLNGVQRVSLAHKLTWAGSLSSTILLPPYSKEFHRGTDVGNKHKGKELSHFRVSQPLRLVLS